MKLFSWAHKKLLPTTTSLDTKNQHNADRLFEISTSNLTCVELGVQARASRDAHAEVLAIGTLGLGSLLSMHNAGEEEEEEEEEEELEEEAHNVSPIARSPSPNRESMSSNRASTSSNPRGSISSNRESVSSVDIQKLQEELQKILYFKLGQGHKGDINEKSNASSDRRSKGKAKKKHKRDNHAYINDANAKHISNADGKSHVPTERGLLPLHNFLEMPMDNMPNNSTRPPYKVLSKKQYLLLMQSLKSKFLHYTSPTRVKLSSSLFEKLVKPNFQRDLQQHGSTMDKMLHILRKVMNKRPHGRWRKGQDGKNYEENEQNCTNEEDEDEERLKWVVAKSCKGSERFINYIASTLGQGDKDQTSLIQNQNDHCHYQDQYHCCEEGGSLQLMLATSPSLDNECWIKTDDEYLVLEL